MLPEWIPAYEPEERRLPPEVREKLLAASGRTLDRLLAPLRGQGSGRSLTRPGTLLRQQIPIRGSVWEDGKAGWLEVDPVALCGGSVAGEFVGMVDGVDYATTWVAVRAIWGRGQAGTLAALRDVEASRPFALLGLDSDNGGEFLNYHVLRWSTNLNQVRGKKTLLPTQHVVIQKLTPIVTVQTQQRKGPAGFHIAQRGQRAASPRPQIARTATHVVA